MAHLEGAYVQLDKRLGDMASNIDARFAQVDRRFEQVDRRFESLDQRFDAFERKFDAKFDGLQWRMTALIVGTWTTTILAVFLHH